MISTTSKHYKQQEIQRSTDLMISHQAWRSAISWKTGIQSRSCLGSRPDAEQSVQLLLALVQSHYAKRGGEEERKEDKGRGKERREKRGEERRVRANKKTKDDMRRAGSQINSILVTCMIFSPIKHNSIVFKSIIFHSIMFDKMQRSVTSSSLLRYDSARYETA